MPLVSPKHAATVPEGSAVRTGSKTRSTGEFALLVLRAGNWLDRHCQVEYDGGVVGPLSKHSKEAKVKRTTKLEIKKVTLRNLDEPTLNAMAGGLTGTCVETICGATCKGHTCIGKTCATFDC